MDTEKARASDESVPLIRVQHLNKRYASGGWLSRKGYRIIALDDVSLTIDSGCTLALVGESGSGKSTFARCLTRLTEPDSGEIWFRGVNLLTLRSRELSAARRQIQLVFQDFTSALNPRFSAAEIVGEPLLILGHDEEDRRKQALQMMEEVGLSTESGNRSPNEFSGGQRQRLAIARALILRPALVILDEALSSLDIPVQAQIADLLLELQTSFALTYLYISHDLRMAGHMASKVAVMQQGRIVESGEVEEVFSRPRHPHTRILIASIPRLGDERFEAVRFGR